MFKKLKNKLKNWTKKITEKIEEVPEEEIQEKQSSKETTPKIKEEFEKPIKNSIKKTLEEKTPEKETSKEKIQEKQSSKEITEKIEEVPEENIEKKSFLKKLTSKISKIKISKKYFEEYSEELEISLLENNVAFEVVEKIIKQLKEEIIGKEFEKKEIEKQINQIFEKIIKEILIEPFDIIEKIKSKEKKPFIILFCGINGTGKTTTIAKIAKQLKDNNITSVLAAGDTFRAASIEQLKEHGKKLNIEVVAHEYNSDPASVGFDAIKYAEKNKIDCVLIDTAGRMHTSKNLMAQIEKISRVTKPDLKIFIGESITGNDAIEQIKSFNDSINIDGIILTKADIDEKGGTALSVGYITKKPILYLGTGQEYQDLEKFDKEKFLKKLNLNEE